MIDRRPDTAMQLPRRATLAMLASLAAGFVWQGPLQAQDSAGIDVQEMWLGAEDAKVEVREYASLTCPHCARFHEVVYPYLKAEFIDTGKIRFVFREVYFDRSGLWAAILARCAEPSRYFAVVDLLLKRQDDWSREKDPAKVAERLIRIGSLAGMSRATIAECMQDRDFALAMIKKSESEMKADDVEGTPSIVINGVNHGNLGYSELRRLINDELGN